MSGDRLFVVGRASWDLFVPAFRTALRGYGLTPKIVVCGFDRELLLWSGDDDDFASDPPQAIIVFPEARDLFERHFSASHTEMSPEDAGNQAADFLLRAVSSLSATHPSVTWILSTAELAFPSALAAVNDSDTDPLTVATNIFNSRLRRACRE